MSNKIVILCTVSSEEQAARIGHTVVTEELAACVNVVPGIRSIYRWEGAVEESAELLLVMKSTTDCFEALRQRIVELHSYEVPEVIALPIHAGHAPYLAWIENSTRKR